MSSNAKRCSNCSSTSMEHCLQIKCKYWVAGSHLDNKKCETKYQGEENEKNKQR
jgi:hypothetical protein